MHLIKLSDEREFQIPDHEPQLLDYTFCNQAGDRLGEIDDLIADTESMKVRFLIVSLDQGLLTSRKVVVPLRDVSVDEDGERVICLNCSQESLQAYPTYDGGALPDLQKRFAATFVPVTGAIDRPLAEDDTIIPAETMNTGVSHDEGLFARAKDKVKDLTDRASDTIEGSADREDLYDRNVDTQRMQLAEEKLEVGKRDVQAGEVTLRKNVVEEEVSEPIELFQERVTIERHPVNREAPGTAIGSGETEINMPLMAEEPVVHKVPVIREEVELRKQPELQRQEIKETLKREELDTSDLSEVRKADDTRLHEVRKSEALAPEDIDDGVIMEDKRSLNQDVW